MTVDHLRAALALYSSLAYCRGLETMSGVTMLAVSNHWSQAVPLFAGVIY